MTELLRAFNLKEQLKLSWSSFKQIAAMAECPVEDPDQLLSSEAQARLIEAATAWQQGIGAVWLSEILERHELWLETAHREGQRANLQGACLSGANLEARTLAHALLMDADLSHVEAGLTNFDQADLTGADFTKAQLRRARFCGSTLFDVSLEGARLGGAIIDDETIERSEWEEAQVARWLDRGGKHYSDQLLQDDASQDFSDVSLSVLVDELDRLTYLRYRNKTNDSQTFNDQDQRRLRELVGKLWGRPRAKPGDIVAEAKLEEVLGKGAFGTVWRAKNVDTNEPRAVKIFDHDRLGDGLAVHLFRRGVRAMQYLRQCVEEEHSRSSLDPLIPLTVVQIREIEPSMLAFAMDLVPDRDLSHGQIRGKSIAEKVKIFTSIAKSVRYAHTRRQPIVHRDLKPQNIVMNGDCPVLTDFDIADMSFAKTLSRRAVGGAFAYAAPEQLSGECDHLEFRSDIYSLGRLLHFFLIEEDPPLLIEAEPVLSELDTYPEGLVKIIRKCTYRELPHRYDSVDALLSDLARYEESAAVGAYGPNPKLAKRYWERALSHAKSKSWAAALEAGSQALAYLPPEQEKNRQDWRYSHTRWQWRDGNYRLSAHLLLLWWKRLSFAAALFFCVLLASPLLYLGVMWVIRGQDQRFFEERYQTLLKMKDLNNAQSKQAVLFFRANAKRLKEVRMRLLDAFKEATPEERCRLFVLLYRLAPLAPEIAGVSNFFVRRRPVGRLIRTYLNHDVRFIHDFGHVRCVDPQNLPWIELSFVIKSKKRLMYSRSLKEKFKLFLIRLSFFNAKLLLFNADEINLSGSHFVSSELRFSNIREASCYRLFVEESDLFGADFRNTKLNHSQFFRTSLQFVDFRGADLSNVRLFFSDLRGAHFEGTDVHYTDFRGNLLSADAIPVLRRGGLAKVVLHSSICLSSGIFLQPGLAYRCYAWHRYPAKHTHWKRTAKPAHPPAHCPSSLAKYGAIVAFPEGHLKREGHCPWKRTTTTRPTSRPSTQSAK